MNWIDVMNIQSHKIRNFLKTSFLLLFLGAAHNTQAQIIEVLCTASEPCGKSSGTTNDGTIFQADANPSMPATGTGVFKPFVRIQDSTGTQSGYNTDTGNPATNYDTKAGLWTHSVLFGDLGTVNIGGLSYYQLSLDANENGQGNSIANQIDLTEMQIFLGDSRLMTPEAYGGYTGTQFDGSAAGNTLAGYNPAWSLDNVTNGDVTIILQSSICDTPGQCGSGKGDLDVFIPVSLLSGSPNDYFVLYTEYDRVGSGFEEWSYLSKERTVPEPGALILMALGLISLGVVRKLKK
jgi:hypothetical protein